MYLYAVKNGKRILLASGGSIGDNIVTNGTAVYYSCYVNGSGTYSASMYRISSIGKKSKKLFSVPWGLNLEGYYNGMIYYTKGEFDDTTFCSYNTKSGKRKEIANGMVWKQYKNCYYLAPPNGDFGSIPFRVYNAKTKKTRTISKGMLTYFIASDQVYYVEGKRIGAKNGRELYNSTVKKCTLSGTGKKTLSKKLKITGIIRFTKKSLTYYNENGKKKTKKF